MSNRYASSTILITTLCLGLLLGAGCSSDDGDKNPGGTPDIGSSDTGGGNLDTGTPQPDSGIPVPDTGGPLPDTGTPVQDTGTPVNDTGTPTQDTGTPVKDKGAPTPDTAPPPPPSPFDGQVVITEFMANPLAVADSKGEYIELYNTTASAIDVKDWTLKDDGSDSHKIASSVSIPAGGYVVLAVNDVAGENGGLPTVAYKYSSYFLGQKGDEIVLLDADGKLVDKVAYPDSTIVPGASHQLIDPAQDNGVLANWCLAGQPWSGSAGDNGTPGAAAICAAPGDGAAVDAGAPADTGAGDTGPAGDLAVDATGTD